MGLFANLRRWIVTFGLLVLLALAVVGLIMTRDSGQPQTSSRRKGLVDQRPLQTARAVAALASGWEEQRYARQALRLADHAVDLAFARAFRDTATQDATQTLQARQGNERVGKAEAQTKADQEQIDRLKKEMASAPESQHPALQQQLSLLQAQLELDQDELDDAKEDLARMGGDTRARLQRQFERHQADEQQLEALATPSSSARPQAGGSNVLSQFEEWKTLRNKTTQLKQARQEAIGLAISLNQAHDSLQAQADAERSKQSGNTEPAPTVSPAAGTAKVAAPSNASLASLKLLAKYQKDLADLDKSIQDSKDLADNYFSWSTVAESRQQMALHGLLRSALWIIVILLLIYEAGRLSDRLLAGMTHDRKRLQTLRVIVRFSVQAVGLLVIVFVILGLPAQTATILGLAGAGLTVVLKDFIVAFFGWFVLMGRHGIRVGDWVEVNGVVGEVAEISLMRTILLETGNWTDTGHPTGRKVAFLNGFAIEGHFFNFSTAGQWLWDELQILVPTSQDPYFMIEEIQKVVTAETGDNSKTAEQEWQRATSQYRMNPVSAAPDIQLRPTSAGVEVHVRYITRAQDRYATRAHLYQALLDLLHRKPAAERGEAVRTSR